MGTRVTRKRKSTKTIDLAETIANADSVEVMSPQELMRQHLNEATEEHFECPQCFKRFSKKYNLQKHMAIHNDKIYQCDFCDSAFKTLQYLNVHSFNVHKKKTASDLKEKCKFCAKRFRFRSDMLTHERVHTGEKPYKCKECEKSFSVPYTLQTHMYTHTGEKPFACTYCDYKCRDSSTLRKHKARHEGFKEEHPCPSCKKMFRSKETFQAHMSQDHLGEQTRLSCELCGKTFRTRTTLLTHVRQVHKRTSAVRCDICDKNIAHKGNLAAHMATHSEERPHACLVEGCEWKFKTKSDLQKHGLKHAVKHYECDECNRKFALKSHIAYHIRAVHNKRKRFKCNVCGVRFYGQKYLDRHKLWKHSEEKDKYYCDHCDFVTKNKPSLVNHIRRHDDTKNLTCRICKNGFEYKDLVYLRSHYLRTHKMRYKPIYKKFLKNKKKEKQSKKPKPKPDPPKSESPLSVLIVKEEMFDEEETVIQAINTAEEITQPITFQELKKDEVLSHKSASVISGDLAKSLDAEKSEDEMSFDDFVTKNLDESKRSTIKDKVRSAIPDPEINEELSDDSESLLDEAKSLEKAKSLEVAKSLEKAKSLGQAKSLENRNKKKEPDTVDEFIAENRRKTRNSDHNNSEPSQSEESDTDEELQNSLDQAKSLEKGAKKELGQETFEQFIERSLRKRKLTDNEEESQKDPSNKGKALKHYQIEKLERKERKARKKQQMFAERDALSVARREYNERIMEIARKIEEKGGEKEKLISKDETNDTQNETQEEKDQESTKNYQIDITNGDLKETSDESTKEYVIVVDNTKIMDGKTVDIETDKKGENNEGLKMTMKDGKVQFNMSQCYVCFKLFETKQKLIDHCAEHFDVCNVTMLRKCPLCDYVATTNFSRHLKIAHDLSIRVKSSNVVIENDGKFEKTLVYSNNEEIKTLEVIPSVKNLNNRCSKKIDAERKDLRKKGTLKDNLVKRGNEWVVEKNLQKIDYKKYLLPLDSAMNVNIETPKLDYLEKMTRLNNLAKKEGYKILYPCDKCDQVCTGLAALKAHYNIHNPRPKQKRNNHPLKLAKKKGSKIRKSNAELKSFFEQHIKGTEMDFLEFSRAFESVDNDVSDVE